MVHDVVVTDSAANAAAILDRAASTDPTRTALIHEDVACSYGMLSSEVQAWAAELAAAGVRAGDRVPLVDWGGVRSIAVTLAAAHLGAATAQMNPMLTSTELAVLVDASNCCAIGVATTEAHDSLGAALRPGGIVIDRAGPRAEDHPASARVGGGDDDAMILFTSGTTGHPKPVAVSHRSLMARICAYRAPFDPNRPPAVTLMCVPPFHIGGMLGLLLTLYAGDTTVVLSRFDAERWLDSVARHRVTSGFLVPTMLARILDHPSLATTDTTSLRSISYGAAAAPRELIGRAMLQWPDVGFANVFGQTETLGAYTSLSPDDHRDPRRVGSVGRPLPGVEVKVVDPTDGGELARGELGELWVRSGQVMPGDLTDGWFATGDLARHDTDGYLFPAGRLSDTINRGGEKFAPAEVAEVLRHHPSIADVVVVGVPDPEMGERVGAAIVLRTGADDIGLVELRSWCAPTVASFKLPEVTVSVDALPYNELGKLSRAAALALFPPTTDHEQRPHP